MSNSQSWATNMDKLKSLHSEIYDLIDNKSVAYIDIPIHYNVGDLLIYKGTESFFSYYNVNVVYRADSCKVNFKELEKAEVILFHGGGNFGDLYPLHQKLREKIVIKYPNKRIICLPQTILFTNKIAQEQSRTIFCQHNDFYFFVRDLNSKKIAFEFTKNVKLMPDMAHSLHPLVDSSEIAIKSSSNKILNLVRKDIESKDIEANRNINKNSFDWEDIITVTDNFLYKKYKRLSYLAPYSANYSKKSITLWSKITHDIVFKSIEYFYIKDCVYTDRLHGLILSSLLGKYVYLYDNTYGKNFSYFDLWLKDNPMINKIE
ncbi:polysaccharide pyruvyl transferase family protein [Photobacterium carnosum]|uniref:polysaccharide pyruvyl transferase family protein n=1 Tax=Photobacterium carnosum TaxID=2023717 RepID=UPI001E432C9C|nr:polysaccharide pyruvyl transferase family protein [Photobacterium carnosum]MCD9539150.1 polysaccharide pyruvyl transferase [Photobacterium carnosum]MCF2163638.1 polysaccharide pyruvyl transferase [Photobacterium carnosum]